MYPIHYNRTEPTSISHLDESLSCVGKTTSADGVTSERLRRQWCFGEIEPDLARELTVGLFRHRVETEGPKATVAEFARWSRSDDPRTRVAIAEAWLQGTRQAGAPTGQP